MKINYNTISCLEAKVVRKSGKPYLYYKGLLNNGLVVTLPYINLDAVSLTQIAKTTSEFNVCKREGCKYEISFEVQPIEDNYLFTIENSYTVDTELKIFYKNRVRKVKIVYVSVQYDSKENYMHRIYILKFIDEEDGASIKLREAELKEKEVL